MGGLSLIKSPGRISGLERKEALMNHRYRTIKGALQIDKLKMLKKIERIFTFLIQLKSHGQMNTIFYKIPAKCPSWASG